MAGAEGEGRRSTSDEHEMHKGYSSPSSARHAGMEAIGAMGRQYSFQTGKVKAHLSNSVKNQNDITILSIPLPPCSRNFKGCTTYEFPKFPILG